MHRHDAAETCDLCWIQDTSCDLSVVSGPCRTLELAALSLDFGFGVQAELRTDSTAAEGLGRYDPSTAQLFRCSKQSHDGTMRNEKHAGWTPSRDSDAHRSAGRADVAL